MNDLRDAIELGWYILTGIISAAVTMLVQAFRMGGKLEKLASKEELDHYLTRREFDVYKSDAKEDFNRLEGLINDTRREIIEVIRETR